VDLTSRTTAVEGARSIGNAASALLRTVGTDQGNLETSLERLELNAVRAVDQSTQRFDAGTSGEPTEEDMLVVALSQLSIGNTLLAAESAVASPQQTDRLRSAVTELETMADALEAEDALPTLVQGFDTSPDGSLLGVVDAALAALDEMASTAADVATAVLDKALKPLVERVPATLRDLGGELNLDIPGRLARWGLRAVRGGLDLLLQLVDLEAVERVRARIDQVLARLGQGEDSVVLAGWAIGADAVRAILSDRDPSQRTEREALVRELAELTERFGRLCRLLRRIAVAVASLAATLALLHIALPQAVAVTTLGLVLVLAAVVVVGRDYTGASDLPGRVRGVRLLVGAGQDAPS
jgi:hypothetical protein